VAPKLNPQAGKVLDQIEEEFPGTMGIAPHPDPEEELPKVSVKPVVEEGEDKTGFGPNSYYTPPEERTPSVIKSE
jgi:hypothetical protein